MKNKQVTPIPPFDVGFRPYTGGQYQASIPMLLDDSLTQIQKMNRLSSHLHYVDDTLAKALHYISNVGSVTQINVTELEKDIEKFKDDTQQVIIDFEDLMQNQYMPDAVEEILTEWTNDGRFDNIIEGSVFQDFSTRLSYQDANLQTRGINVLAPPAPFVAAKGDNTTDDTAAINAILANFFNVYFPHANYKITQSLKFRHGHNIIADDIVFNGELFNVANGGAVMDISNVGDNFFSLPPIVYNPAKGNSTLQFTGDPGLKKGDIVCIYDETPSSYSPARDYYKKGEYLEVASVDNLTVTFKGKIKDDYVITSNLKVVKMNMGEFSLVGNIKIVNGTTSPMAYGIHMKRVKNFLPAGNIVSEIAGGYASVAYEQCYNCEFNGTATQVGESGSGLDYGFAAINSQEIRATGNFTGQRHGIANTGKDGIGAIVTRSCTYSGTVTALGTSSLGGSLAFDSHGNCEDISFTGSVYGGVKIGGRRNKISGTIHANSFGVCVYGAEMKDFQHDLSGCVFYSDGAPTNRGIIDFGGLSEAEVVGAIGGTINLSNIQLYAPSAEIGIYIRTRKAFDSPNDINVLLSNSIIEVNSGSSTSRFFVMGSDILRHYNIVDLSNITSNVYRLSCNANHTNQLVPYFDQGFTEIQANQNTNKVVGTVSFNKQLPANFNFNVLMTLSGNYGDYVVKPYAVTAAGFTYELSTASGANFPNSTINFGLRWKVF